jgi:hypothetical protein
MRTVFGRMFGIFGLACASACVPTENKSQSEQRQRPLPAPNSGNQPGQRGAKASPTLGLERLRNPEDMAGSPATASTASSAEAKRFIQAVRPDKSNEAAQPLLRKPFVDSFERAELGPDFHATAPVWQLQSGQLCVNGAHNHPVWLTKRLPTNARIEFDVVSSSAQGDIKAEYWGDGTGAATSTSYTNASSYLTIFGGWKNQYHVLARLDEHAQGRPEVRLDKASTELRARPVQPNQTYHFKVERSDGKTVRWSVDDIEILSFSDPNPLKGKGHDHFGFNDWEVPLCFDNLKITPLEGE